MAALPIPRFRGDDEGDAVVTYRAAPPETLRIVPLDALTLIYHRASGITHIVDTPVPDRYDGDTLVISVLEEVPVVVKRLRVVEELHIERRTMTGRRRERVTLRRQEPITERLPPGRPAPDTRRRP